MASDESVTSVGDGLPPQEVAFGHFLVPRRPDGGLWELGRGAMGVTYRAFDTSLRTEVALKVIRAEQVANEDTRRRFQREARAAAKIRHPNVASVLYLGEQSGEFFYAMEFIAGRTLESLIKDAGGPLPPVVAVALAAQAAAALNAAHKRGVVHRDLKPGNLMLLEGDALDHEDERTIAAGDRLLKVIDFGLARSFGANRQEDSLVTQTFAGFIGTPAYASPEQCVGGDDLDGRSDLYSLGIILWQMLAGRLPFTGGVVEVLGKHQFQPPPAAQLAALPAPVAALVTGLLVKDPAERQPPSAGELRSALDRCLRELTHAGSSVATVPPTGEAVVEHTRETTVTPIVGTTLLARYRLGREVGEGDGGKLFLAADIARGGQSAALKLVPPERLRAEPGFLAQLETALEKVRRHPHPALLALLGPGVERSGESAFYVREWADGFSLDELLRAREGELSAGEVFRLLDALPDALDLMASQTFPWLEVALHKLFVVPSGGMAGVDWSDLRKKPVLGWSPFALKLNPLGFPPAADAGTPELTLVASRWQDGSHSDAAHPVAALARLVRELFGSPSQGTASVTALNEEANAVLRRAADGGPRPAFADASEFWRALRQAADGIVPATSPSSGNVLHENIARPAALTRAPERAGARTVSPPGVPVVASPPVRRSGVFAVAAAVFLLLVAVIGVWRLSQRRFAGKDTDPLPPVSPIQNPVVRDTPAAVQMTPLASAAAPVAATVSEHPGNGSPIAVELKTDKTLYHEGDDLVVTVRLAAGGHLRLLYQNAAGEIYTLFPNQYITDDRIEGGRTVQVIPAADPTQPGREVAIQIQGPYFGVERLAAVVTDQPFADEDDLRAELRTMVFRAGIGHDFQGAVAKDARAVSRRVRADGLGGAGVGSAVVTITTVRK